MRITIVLAALGALLAPSAQAQGIDCTKARSPAERAICATPGLMALDRQVAEAYADAVRRQPERAAELRGDTLAWLRARDAACAVPAAELPRCLSGQMTARLAALTPPAAAPAAVPPAVPPAVPAAATRPASVPPGPAAPAATVEPETLRAAAQADATLRVSSPGRFTVAARSRTGVALQFVDMLAGPAEPAGEAGARDGRLDLLLDVGTYRLRSFAAPGADETVTLAVTPFADAAPVRALPPPGETVSATLADAQQRAFWLLVPPSGAVRIEAAGRALADLRLWRNGRELAALVPVARRIEPQPAHPMTDLLLAGSVEPGLYLVTAYGGPALPWTDGAAAQPFHLRAGLPDTLAEGWAAGPVGPFGSEVFAAPAFAGSFRLDLPQPAEASLHVDGQAAALSRTSREPRAVLRGTPGQVRLVEVRGREGQAFTLRASELPGPTVLSRTGAFWVSAVTAGTGGDEVPPTVLLQRLDSVEPPRLVADNLPLLGPGAWHGRFNLRGPTALLFRNPTGGPVTLRTSGVPLQGDPTGTQRYELPADFFVLRVQPQPGAAGVLDVVAGPPGAAVPPVVMLPPDPVVPLGVQAVGPGQSLRLSAQGAPGAATGLSARPLPVALAAAPLLLTQVPGSAPLVVPVTIAPGGSLTARELGGADVPVLDEPGADAGTRRVTVPAASRPRTVVLAWRRTTVPAADIPAPPAVGATATLAPGVPLPFDLGRGETRGFALSVPEGGLLRVETTGRLRTAGRLATAFMPELDKADANGTGQNLLMQRWLRAGRYRVDVTAVDSAGHGAVLASPAPLLDGAALVPDGSVRATLPAGTGIAIPIRIPVAGRFHLDLAGLGRAFTARLDDAEGWPLTVPGELTALDRDWQPGSYRLTVSPDAVTRQLVARLLTVPKDVPVAGHGPHPLPFGPPQQATWREPPGRADPRTPDAWTFSLVGPAETTLAVTDGMVGELRRADAAPEARPIARITDRWTGRLEAGAYRVDAASLGRNDRLDYTLTLTAKEMQPGEVRAVALPATVPFSLAEPRVVSLTTFGVVAVKAVLRRADGGEVVRGGSRADDWNVAIARPLPAGAYRLELAAAVPPSGGTATPQDPGVAAPAAADEDAPEDDQAAQATTPSDASAETAAADEPGEQRVELRLELPAPLPPVPAPSRAAVLAGTGVHVLPVPQPEDGALVVAGAEADGGMVLTLERQDATGWRVVAQDEGRAPLVAALADGGQRPWRVQAWLIDGGPAPIRLAARVLDGTGQALGSAALGAVDGFPQPLAAARVVAGRLGVLSTDRDGLLAASWPGRAADPVQARQITLQDDAFWLLGRAPGPVALAPLPVLPDVVRSIGVPPGGVAVLGAAPGGALAVWRAESAFGQPGLAAGTQPGGIAPGSAVALAGPSTVLRNAGAYASLQAAVRLVLLEALPGRRWEPGFTTVLPPHAALRVELPGPGAVTATLAGETAILGDAPAWTGGAALTRTFDAAGEVLLVNAGATPAPASLAWAAAEAAPLRPGVLAKRFFGAAGSFDRATDAGQLAVAGNASLVWQGADGRVLRGRALTANGPGRVTVTHGSGAVVLSLAAPGASPWPDPAPEPATLPQRLALHGAAMAVSLLLPDPALLSATTTAPVLLGLGNAPPELFPAGAELHRALPAGPVVLRVVSPHDGELSGTLSLAAAPIRPARDGLGDGVAVAPGGTAAFGFALAKPATVGVGVRAEPDRATVRLLDAKGAVVGEGVSQLRALPAGRYVLEARVPPDAPATTLRTAILGTTPRGNGPPPDIAQHYLELVGLAPQEPAR